MVSCFTVSKCQCPCRPLAHHISGIYNSTNMVDEVAYMETNPKSPICGYDTTKDSIVP